MHKISVKELLEKFPFSGLKKGKSFLIIDENKPLAKLQPIYSEEEPFKE